MYGYFKSSLQIEGKFTNYQPLYRYVIKSLADCFCVLLEYSADTAVSALIGKVYKR